MAWRRSTSTVRLAARGRPGDDARDVCQYSIEEPAGARDRRGRDDEYLPTGEVMAIYDAAMKYKESERR